MQLAFPPTSPSPPPSSYPPLPPSHLSADLPRVAPRSLGTWIPPCRQEGGWLSTGGRRGGRERLGIVPHEAEDERSRDVSPIARPTAVTTPLRHYGTEFHMVAWVGTSCDTRNSIWLLAFPAERPRRTGLVDLVGWMILQDLIRLLVLLFAFIFKLMQKYLLK